MWLGAMVGTGSTLYYYPDLQDACKLPAGSSITQVIDFPNNQPDRSANNIITVALPSSSRYASVLAGQSSPKKERLTDLQCLFGSIPMSPTDITQKDRTTSFKIRTDYIAFGVVDTPSVTAEGLQFTARTYAEPPEFHHGWPEGTKITLAIKAPGRHLIYSRPPSQRDADILTWAWTLTSPKTSANGPQRVTITVPLGNGEHTTALLRNAQGTHLPYISRLVGNYSIFLAPDLQPLLGWLGPIAATLSLLLMLRWYGRRANVQWRALSVALLVLALPLLVSVDVSWHGWRLPVSTAFLLICVLLSAACFRGALISTPLREDQPALTGRSAGVASWLPLVSLPLLAFVLGVFVPPHASSVPGHPPTLDLFATPDVGAQFLLTWLNIAVVFVLVWAVSALVLTFTRTSLRAVSVWTTPDGSLANTGGIGTAVVRWYHLVAGAVIVVSAYAVGYGLANPIGKAFNAYHIDAASAKWASTLLATDIGNIGVYPVLFLLLPVAATMIAATISSTMSSSAITVGLVATATLAWATTSRVLDLEVVGTSLPVGAWILTALVALSLRKALRDSVSRQAEPWLPAREPPQTDSSSRTPLRIRLGRWLAPVETETPKDPPPPGNVVQRGPFRDACARANLALAWATLLSLIPVAYLVLGNAHCAAEKRLAAD